jgi:hypothetical protein
MNQLLTSLKADLSDRRLLPLVALVTLGLAAAVAYAVLGGGSSGSSPSAVAGRPSTPPITGLAVSEPATERAVAETTDGAAEQRKGHARDPFSLLVSAAASTTAASGSSKSSSSSSSASTPSTSPSGASTTGGTGSSGAEKSSGETTKPAPTPKKGTVYAVAIEFGVLPPGTTPQSAKLTAYPALKLQTPLPSAAQPLLVFRGVTAKGKSATFTLVGEAILTGTGSCLPSPTKCQAVDVKPGATEQLSYLAPNGETTVYELRVTGITALKASAAAAKRGWAESKAGRELLRRSGLVALPFLTYSSQPGVLVFAAPRASGAKAHGARRRHHG